LWLVELRRTASAKYIFGVVEYGRIEKEETPFMVFAFELLHDGNSGLK
jgi:hypothetical protein